MADHAAALTAVAERGQPGATYTIGGNAERTNLAVVQAVCDLVDEAAPSLGHPRRDLISFVTDRPGHDFRYAIDSTTIRDTLGWAPSVTFEEGLASTVRWYLDNEAWWGPLTDRGATQRRGVAAGRGS